MGMYTEMVLAVELKPDTPKHVLAALVVMTGTEGEDYSLPDSPLFQTDRWMWMLKGSSSYFAGDSRSTLIQNNISENCHLTVRCNIKNYESELEKFLEWITPYVYPRGFAGYTRYEETEEPTLIYFDAETGLVRKNV